MKPTLYLLNVFCLCLWLPLWKTLWSPEYAFCRDGLNLHNSGGWEYILSGGLWSLQRPRDGSEQWCSLRLRSWGCSNSITWEPVRHANSLAPPQTKSETLDVRSGNFGSNRPSRWFWCSLNFKKHESMEHRLWTSLLSLNLISIPSEPVTMNKLFNLVTPLFPHL